MSRLTNALSGLTRLFLNVSVSVSKCFDRILPAHYSVDGWTDFCYHTAPPFFTRGALVYDVGGGKAPYLSVETKRKLGVTVTGVDIDPNELAAAPQGAYDATICGDICHLEGNQDGDIVIAVSVLEHVRDVSAALNAISTFLKPSGKALLFVPSRTALYAKLNLLLPERIKRRILEMVLPGSLSRMGFKAYYDRCTPSKLAKLARDNQLMVDTVNRYYFSPYLMFFFPLHILARLRQLLLQALSADAGVETFALILSRK